MIKKKLFLKKRIEEINVEEIAYIIMNLRKYTKYWGEHFGHNNRKNKKYWEEKSDEWIENNVKTEV